MDVHLRSSDQCSLVPGLLHLQFLMVAVCKNRGDTPDLQCEEVRRGAGMVSYFKGIISICNPRYDA